MPPVVNPLKQDTMQGNTQGSPFQNSTANPFNTSGFAPSQTHLSRVSEPTLIADSLISMCEHAKTGNVKVISDILLQQVDNLSKTDKNCQFNLEIAGGSLEKIRFVRGSNYLH